jgi:hypothetical protein
MGIAVGAAGPAGAGTAAQVREREQTLPVLPALAPLFPHGALRRGSTVVVGGSTSLLIALLAAASEAGSWGAVIGLPAFGAAAAAEAGVALDRLALVPAPGPDWPTVTAALLDALDLVAVAPGARIRAADARRLAARARQRGAVLLPFGLATGGWEGADLRLSLAGSDWTGLDAGWGHLTARRALVRADGRSGRPRHTHLWLQGIAPEVPLQAGSAPGRALPDRAGRIGPDRAGADRVGADRPGPAPRPRPVRTPTPAREPVGAGVR